MMKQNKEIPKGYKDSPLGIIPEEWEVKRFGEIFSFKNGINASKENYGKGVKFVNTMDVLANDSLCADLLRGSVCVTEKQEREFAVYDGDILFNRTSETREEVGCSSVYLDDNEAVFGGFIIRARCLDNTLFDYYKKYCFKTNYIRNQITSFGNGAIRYNLGQEDLSKVTIILPPLSEQQKIAEILSTWDKATEKQTALIEKLELRKRGLMQQLLTGKKRLKGFDKEWKKNKLADICKIYKGKALSAQDITEGSYPVIAGGRSSPYNHNEFTDENVITISASGAYAGYIALHKYRIWASDCSVVKEIKSISSIDFLFALLTYQQKFIYSLQCGGAQPHVFPKDIASLEYKLPPFSEQKYIVNIFIAASKEIDIKNDALKLLKEQKKGLMQKLLTGKIKVNP